MSSRASKKAARRPAPAPPTDQTGVPTVTCVQCARRVDCIRVADGTVYRPLTWAFPFLGRPYEGYCVDCA